MVILLARTALRCNNAAGTFHDVLAAEVSRTTEDKK